MEPFKLINRVFHIIHTSEIFLFLSMVQKQIFCFETLKTFFYIINSNKNIKHKLLKWNVKGINCMGRSELNN